MARAEEVVELVAELERVKQVGRLTAALARS